MGVESNRTHRGKHFQKLFVLTSPWLSVPVAKSLLKPISCIVQSSFATTNHADHEHSVATSASRIAPLSWVAFQVV
jgi:hypothetical protein